MEIIHHRGQVNEATLANGRVVKREDNSFLFVVMGETISSVGQVDDQDHFLYQNHLPITRQRVQEIYGGILPAELRGPLVMCTCGSDGVVITSGPYAGKAMCRMYVMTGFHQTSHKIQDNVLTLNKKAESERTADPSDIIKDSIRYKPDIK